MRVVSRARASAGEPSADGVWGRSPLVMMETVPEAPELEAGAQKK
ncbi:hypothetical protein [Ilumatobacter sp.]